MENQLKVRASDESILEEEEIISLLLKRQILRQMSLFLTLAKRRCWAVMTTGTLGGSHSPGKFCDCCRAQKDAAVSLPPPASWLPFMQVPCWPPSCWWSVPSQFAVRLDQHAQGFAQDTDVTRLHLRTLLVQGLKGDKLCLIYFHQLFLENWISYWISHGFAFIYNYQHTAAISHHPQQMHSEAHRHLSLEVDSPIQKKYRKLRGKQKKKHKPQSKSLVHL